MCSFFVITIFREFGKIANSTKWLWQRCSNSILICLATIGVCVFGALTSVGALFYFWEEKSNVKKMIALLISTSVLFCLVCCGKIDDNNVDVIKVPVSNGEWDTILLNCENEYFIVQKTIETYNSINYTVGVVDVNNNWIRRLSSSNSLAECISNESGKTSLNGNKTHVGSGNFYYLGNGVVVASLGVSVKTEDGETISVGRNSSISRSGLQCYFYNIEKDKSFYHDANIVSTVLDGYIVIENDGWKRITDTGENEINFVAMLAPYSEGLFLGTPDSNWHDEEYGFYDINGNLRIDLSKYKLQDTQNIKFVNGCCNISFKNPAGNIYYATIDKNGNFVHNPSKETPY